MLTQDKITEIYCIADEFCKNFDQEVKNIKKIEEEGGRTHNRSCEMSLRWRRSVTISVRNLAK